MSCINTSDTISEWHRNNYNPRENFQDGWEYAKLSFDSSKYRKCQYHTKRGGFSPILERGGIKYRIFHEKIQGEWTQKKKKSLKKSIHIICGEWNETIKEIPYSEISDLQKYKQCLAHLNRGFLGSKMKGEVVTQTVEFNNRTYYLLESGYVVAHCPNEIHEFVLLNSAGEVQ